MLHSPADPRLRHHRRGRARAAARASRCSPARPAPASPSSSMRCSCWPAAAPAPKWCATAPSAPTSPRPSTSHGTAASCATWLEEQSIGSGGELHAAARGRQRRPLPRLAQRPVGAAAAAARGRELLFDIHGQHEFQSLVRAGDAARAARRLRSTSSRWPARSASPTASG